MVWSEILMFSVLRRSSELTKAGLLSVSTPQVKLLNSSYHWVTVLMSSGPKLMCLDCRLSARDTEQEV